MKSDKKKQPEGCLAGIYMGSVLRSIVEFSVFVLRILTKILIIFGLWVPAVYAIFGLIMYLAFDFSPFDFSTYSTIYLSGAVACVVCSLIISVKNIIIKPAKSIYKGYKHPFWEKKEKEEKEGEPQSLQNRWESYNQTKKDALLNPPEITGVKPKKEYPVPEYLPSNADFTQKTRSESERAKITLLPNWLPKKTAEQTTVTSAPMIEKPHIYFSKLEPGIMVHEYEDRYELYRLEGSKTVPVRVEYK